MPVVEDAAFRVWFCFNLPSAIPAMDSAEHFQKDMDKIVKRI
jgi:hypothetical protein